MTIALFTGSFDPPTLGHLNIIQRASKLVETLYVGIAKNSTKIPLLRLQDRLELMQELVKPLKTVQVVTVNHKTIETAKEIGARFLIRSVRNSEDLEYEKELADIHKRLFDLETLFLFADPTLSSLRSRWIYEMLETGLPLKDYLPSIVENKLSDLRDSSRY